MIDYLIVCRSLTYAQRTARALERAGIVCYILRAPRTIAGEGCSHCVRVSERWLASALAALNKQGMSPKKVFMQDADGGYSEVSL